MGYAFPRATWERGRKLKYMNKNNLVWKVYFSISFVILAMTLIPALAYPRKYGVLDFFVGFEIMVFIIIGFIIAIFRNVMNTKKDKKH